MVNKIVIDGDIVLKVVEKTQAQLISALANTSDIEIEFKNINKWDVSGIRLLCAFKKYCTLLDRNLSFIFPSNNDGAGTEEWIELLNNYNL